jgi:cellobiose-specific phosphotransferase system component IIB
LFQANIVKEINIIVLTPQVEQILSRVKESRLSAAHKIELIEMHLEILLIEAMILANQNQAQLAV